MNRTLLIGLALSLVGLALALISGLAEVLGLGGDPKDIFGWKQIAGVAVGVVLLVAGIVLAWRGTRKRAT